MNRNPFCFCHPSTMVGGYRTGAGRSEIDSKSDLSANVAKWSFYGTIQTTFYFGVSIV